MPRQLLRGRRKCHPAGSPRTDPPPTIWASRRNRSASRRISGGHVCRGASDGIQLGANHPLVPAAPRTTPQYESESVVDNIGRSLAAGEAAVAHPAHPQRLEIRDHIPSPQPSAASGAASGAASNEFNATGSSSSSVLEEPPLTWRTVPVVEDAILHELHTVIPQIVKQRNRDSECHFVIPKHEPTENFTPKIKQDTLSKEPAVPAPSVRFKSTSTMRPSPNKQGALSRRALRQPEPETSPESSFTKPPHPYESGKVSKVNICPVCEKYTVTELDRPADSDPNREALRARFKCDLCRNVFDLGVTPFDPRGSPGVTLYQGDDRFTPPVPPRATYPCPRCWMSTDTSFRCMTLYLKEETRVACQPACPAGRLNVSGANSKTQKRKSMQQVMR